MLSLFAVWSLDHTRTSPTLRQTVLTSECQWLARRYRNELQGVHSAQESSYGFSLSNLTALRGRRSAEPFMDESGPYIYEYVLSNTSQTRSPRISVSQTCETDVSDNTAGNRDGSGKSGLQQGTISYVNPEDHTPPGDRNRADLQCSDDFTVHPKTLY